MRTGEHPFREWVALPCHGLSGSTDENGWTRIQTVSRSPVFERIITTDENGWTCIQTVSCSSLFEWIRTTDENGWKHIQSVSSSLYMTDKNHWRERVTRCIQYVSRFPCLRGSWPLTRMGEHVSSMWVALPCLRRLGPLMRKGEHAFSMWVTFPVWVDQDRWQEEWKCIKHVSRSPMLSGSGLLTRMGEHGVDTHPGSESLSPVWAY